MKSLNFSGFRHYVAFYWIKSNKWDICIKDYPCKNTNTNNNSKITILVLINLTHVVNI